MNIATLISGGVDSAVAVHLLKEAGFTPALFYIRIGSDETGITDDCPAEEDIEMATLIARRYGCTLEIVDLHREYWDQVVAYTLDKVKRGLTPNPDVMCNKLIKFGCFEERYGHHFDRTATGHYATTTVQDGKIWLSTARDPVKDQTDFLAQIDYLQVSRLMFPIGHLTKQEVRQIASVTGLPNARRKDSQGICFLGKIDYNDFLRRHLGEKEGPVVEKETGKILGRHKGYWFHTTGQRRGLGLGGGPWFVVEKNIPENTIYVSKGYDTELQYGNEFTLQDFHWITSDPWKNETGPVPVAFKIRHTPAFSRGTLTRKGDTVHVASDEKLQGIASGQFGVIYDAHCRLCVGSGEII